MSELDLAHLQTPLSHRSPKQATFLSHTLPWSWRAWGRGEKKWQASRWNEYSIVYGQPSLSGLSSRH